MEMKHSANGVLMGWYRGAMLLGSQMEIITDVCGSHTCDRVHTSAKHNVFNR